MRISNGTSACIGECGGKTNCRMDCRQERQQRAQLKKADRTSYWCSRVFHNRPYISEIHKKNYTSLVHFRWTKTRKLERVFFLSTADEQEKNSHGPSIDGCVRAEDKESSVFPSLGDVMQGQTCSQQVVPDCELPTTHSTKVIYIYIYIYIYMSSLAGPKSGFGGAAGVGPPRQTTASVL